MYWLRVQELSLSLNQDTDLNYILCAILGKLTFVLPYSYLLSEH